MTGFIIGDRGGGLLGLGHRRRRRLRRSALRFGPLHPTDLAERSDGHLDLVGGGRLRGDLLEPQARSHQRPHHRARLVPGSQAQRLEGQAGDDGDRQDPRSDPPGQAGRTEEREHEDRQDHHDQQEVRPAPHVERGVAIHGSGIEWRVVLVRGDRLVLGAVVLEHAPDLLHPSDQRQVAQEQEHPEDALGHVQEDPRADLVAGEVGRDRGEHDEHADEHDQGDDHRKRHLTGRELLALLGGLVRRDREGLDPDRQGLAQRDHPPEPTLPLYGGPPAARPEALRRIDRRYARRRVSATTSATAPSPTAMKTRINGRDDSSSSEAAAASSPPASSAAGSSESGGPIHRTTSPESYVWIAGNSSVVTSSGIRALNPNSWSSPGSISPPSQVTVPTTSVSSSPNTSRGSSSVCISTVRSHPGTSMNDTNAIGGNSTWILMVDASSRSVGTRTTNRENEPITPSSGETVTWANAGAAMRSIAATELPTTKSFRMRSLLQGFTVTLTFVRTSSNSSMRATISSTHSPGTESWCPRTTYSPWPESSASAGIGPMPSSGIRNRTRISSKCMGSSPICSGVMWTSFMPTRFGSTIRWIIPSPRDASVENGPSTPASTRAGGRFTSSAVTAITATPRAISPRTSRRSDRSGAPASSGTPCSTERTIRGFIHRLLMKPSARIGRNAPSFTSSAMPYDESTSARQARTSVHARSRPLPTRAATAITARSENLATTGASVRARASSGRSRVAGKAPASSRRRPPIHIAAATM